MAKARPSSQKREREQKKRDRQQRKAVRTAERRAAAAAPTEPDTDIEAGPVPDAGAAEKE